MTEPQLNAHELTITKGPPPKWHPSLYLSDGTHIIQVENTLYKLHKSTLSRFSWTFSDMFAAVGDLSSKTSECSQSSELQVEGIVGLEGSDDSCPIILEQLRCEDWEPFLQVATGEWSERRLSKENILRFLEVSRRFQADTVHGVVEQTLATRSFLFEPYELIFFVREYKLGLGVLRFGFLGLLHTPLYELDDKALTMIGWNVYREVTKLKEAMDIHRRIVATEPPVIRVHHSDCQNPELCSSHWRGIWWNGMGRMLMDGRVDLSYEEAFERFVLLEFGEMGPSCKKAMLERVKEGKAFSVTRPLVDAALNRLKSLVLY